MQLENGKVILRDSLDSSVKGSLSIEGVADIATGTELVMSPTRDGKICGLAGAGKLSCPSSISVVLAGELTKETAVEFTGTTENIKLSISKGAQLFTDPVHSAALGSISMNEGSYAAFAAFPKEFAFRTMPGTEIEYLGSADISSSSTVTYLVNAAYEAIFNAGPIGGSTWSFNIYVTDDRMTVLEFTGDNPSPTTFSGGLSYGTRPTAAAYVKKTGSGTWRLTQGASSNNGTYDVREGVLEYTTIAEKGTASALGTATLTQSEYTGTPDASKAVPYAIKLGSDPTAVSATDTATLKYVGTTVATVRERPVAVDGVGRFATETAALDWTGFSPLQERSTLILGGGAAGCVARSVTDSEDGTKELSVVKEGSGDWFLTDKLTFSGDVSVKQGALTVQNANGYKWFKLVIKKLYDPAQTQTMLSHVGFFAADGTEQGLNLERSFVAESDSTLLKPGEICFGSTGYTQNSSYPLVNITKPLAYNFNGRFGSGTAPKLDTESTWITVIFRLRENAKPVTKFDIAVGWYATATKPYVQTPTDWCLYASPDGVDWGDKPVAGQSDHTASEAYIYWMSDTSVAARSATETSFNSVGFALPDEIPGGVEKLTSLNSIAVANAATLKLIKPLSIDCLRFDRTAGAGTIDGIAFATEGTFELTGDTAGDLSANYTFANCVGVENLANWTVKANGVTRSGWKLEVTDSGLKVLKPGLWMIFK